MDIQIDNQSNEPPFRQIAQQLKAGIRTGLYPQGTLLPSVREIVKNTGVSLTTVQKAFTLLQQENLIYSSPGKGNYVSEASRSFSNRIYVFLPSSSLSFFMKILSGMTEQANALGYEIVLNSLNTDKLDWNQNSIDSLLKAKDEGAAVIFIEEAFGEVKKVCLDTAANIPFVTVEWILDGASSVLNDYSLSIESAFEKICKDDQINSMLILKGRDYQYNATEKMKGFRKIVETRNWQNESEVFYRNSDFDAFSGYEIVKKFYEDHYVDCVFCANDYEAIGVIGALTEKGLLVGKDVKVVGYGDMVDKVTSYFPVTTVSQNLEEIGRQSILAVREILETGDRERHIVETSFVPGRT